MRIPLEPIGLRWCILATAFALACGGCGQSSAKYDFSKRFKKSELVVPAEPGAPPAAEKPQAPSREKAGATPVAGVASQETPKPGMAPPPPVPANVSEWGLSHFVAARILGDARLPSAVQLLIKSPQRTDEEAEMLDKLLRPPQAIYDAKGKRLPGGPAVPPPELVQAVAVALAVNNTDVGRQTLVQLVDGDFSGIDGNMAAAAAMAALLDQDSRQSEQIVLRRLLAPSSRSEQTETESRSETAISPGEIIALRTHASPRFRTLLAQAIIDRAPSFARRQALLPVLCEPNPMNLEAQTLIYQTEFVNPTTGAALERQFALASSQALQVLMGLYLRNPNAPPPSVDVCCWVGRQLWDSPLTGFLDVRQRGLTTLAEAPSAMALAVTIPTRQARINLRRTLNRHWAEGAQNLRAALAIGVMPEPGTAAVLKSLVQENKQTKIDALKAAVPKGVRPIAAKSHNGRPRPPAKPPQDAAEADWEKLIGEATLGYCIRAHAAALTAAAYRPADAAAVAASATTTLAFPLPADSTVREAYRIDWPGKRAALLPRLADDPVKVMYVRIEERAKLRAELEHYRRQMDHVLEHALADGRWLDSLSEDVEDGVVRSLDVLITRASPKQTISDEVEQELTVQILSIEVGKLRD